MSLRRVLVPHPAFPSGAIDAIEVGATRPSAGRLYVRYRVIGRVGDVAWPAETAPERTDQLWEHTCFEAFLRAKGDDAYHEFNFSPSAQWAAYAFDRYRTGMRAVDVEAPAIRRVTGFHNPDSVVEVSASLPVALAGRTVRIGLSAIVEELSGAKSYWALAHPPGQPDFHHSDCFALEITASERP